LSLVDLRESAGRTADAALCACSLRFVVLR